MTKKDDAFLTKVVLAYVITFLGSALCFAAGLAVALVPALDARGPVGFFLGSIAGSLIANNLHRFAQEIERSNG